MPANVNTAKVRGRRKLRFRDYDEVLAEVERLHATPHRALGNWNLGQMLMHLGQAMHSSVEGVEFPVSPWIKVIGRVLIRPYTFYIGFPAGFRLPRSAAKVLIFEPKEFEEGLAMLKSGIARLKSEPPRMAHPVMGPMTPAQWDTFHLRHCEMHLGFLVPE